MEEKNKNMIDKIVHFSDLHLRLYKYHDLYKTILTDMLEQFKKIKPNRIIFSGDLLHSKNQLTPELIDISVWLLDECSKIAKTILIFGNHDGLVNNNERLDSITPIVDSMKNPNIIYYKDRGIYEDENVSWCVYSQFQGNVKPNIEEGKGIKIGIFHGPIQNLKTDLGFDFGEHAYDVNNFQGLDFLLCGDIHKRAIFDIPNGKKGVMIGSVIQQGFGENVKSHGFGILNLQTMEYKTIDLINPKPFLKFEINSYEDIIDGKEKLTNA
jgi:DNA repair exonuclease SbcCD nuclease subunit